MQKYSEATLSPMFSNLTTDEERKALLKQKMIEIQLERVEEWLNERGTPTDKAPEWVWQIYSWSGLPYCKGKYEIWLNGPGYYNPHGQ